MAQFPSNMPASYQQNPNTVNRVGQKQLLPGAVDARNLSPRIPHVGTTFAANSTLLAGQYISFQVITATTNNAVVLCVPDMTTYIDALDADHAFPYGLQPSSFDTTEWQAIVTGNDWGMSNNKDTVTVYYLRNSSANTHTVYFRGQSRWIASEAAGSENIA